MREKRDVTLKGLRKRGHLLWSHGYLQTGMEVFQYFNKLNCHAGMYQRNLRSVLSGGRKIFDCLLSGPCKSQALLSPSNIKLC